MNAASEQARGSPRNPRDVGRDSDAIRADMDRTLEELERKFSPREMMDRSATYLREHGSELVHQVGETVRHNPVPVLLTAAGVIWLTAAVAQARRGSTTGASHTGSLAEEGEYDVGEEELYGGSSVDQDEGDGALRARAARARAAASDVSHRVKGRVQSTVSEARTRATQAHNNFGDFVQDQPVVVGMLALAAGVLLGAAVPVTEYEKHAMARSSDKLEPRAEQEPVAQPGL